MVQLNALPAVKVFVFQDEHGTRYRREEGDYRPDIWQLETKYAWEKLGDDADLEAEYQRLSSQGAHLSRANQQRICAIWLHENGRDGGVWMSNIPQPRFNRFDEICDRRFKASRWFAERILEPVYMFQSYLLDDLPQPRFGLYDEVYLVSDGVPVENLVKDEISDRKFKAGRWMYRTAENFGRNSRHWFAERILEPGCFIYGRTMVTTNNRVTKRISAIEKRSRKQLEELLLDEFGRSDWKVGEDGLYICTEYCHTGDLRDAQAVPMRVNNLYLNAMLCRDFSPHKATTLFNLDGSFRSGECGVFCALSVDEFKQLQK